LKKSSSYKSPTHTKEIETLSQLPLDR